MFLFLLFLMISTSVIKIMILGKFKSIIPRIITSNGYNQCNSFNRSTSNAVSTIILTKDEDGVRNIIMNNQKRRNVLSIDMMNALYSKVIESQDQIDLRCIVISAMGSVFSSGHDLKELIPEIGSKNHLRVFSEATKLIQAIRNCPVPVIAKVDGLAAAAGCQLASSCDIIICSDRSTFSTPGANAGIFCSTPGVAIARLMPRAKSSYMLITGNTISAEYAYQAGLVSLVTTHTKLDEETQMTINSIKSKSRSVVELGKKFFNKQIEMDINSAYHAAEHKMVENLTLEDGKEGIKSFVEKRKPKWSHKSE